MFFSIIFPVLSFRNFRCDGSVALLDHPLSKITRMYPFTAPSLGIESSEIETCLSFCRAEINHIFFFKDRSFMLENRKSSFLFFAFRAPR